MQKQEKILLQFALVGTLVAFAMASISYIFFREPSAPSTPEPVSAVGETDVQDSGSQPMVTGDAASTSALPVFEIDSSRSEVRFTLHELLGGQPTTVIGTTNLVNGTLYFSEDAPQDTLLGEIVVNARGLMTDNDFRNRAIHSQILDTDSYEYIRFTPTSLRGLPDVLTMGETVSLEISGNLTIKDVTRMVTFSAQVTLISETQLEGHAETLVAYADYDIFIPSAPRVAEVDEEVLLEIDFIALPAAK